MCGTASSAGKKWTIDRSHAEHALLIVSFLSLSKEFAHAFIDRRNERERESRRARYQNTCSVVKVDNALTSMRYKVEFLSRKLVCTRGNMSRRNIKV